MIAKPKRKPRLRAGIRPDTRVNRKHKQFVRGFSCAVPGCPGRKIEFAHVRGRVAGGRTDGATSLKPSDQWGIPLCKDHHAEQHQHGSTTFERKYGLRTRDIAIEMAKQSPALRAPKP